MIQFDQLVESNGFSIVFKSHHHIIWLTLLLPYVDDRDGTQTPLFARPLVSADAHSIIPNQTEINRITTVQNSLKVFFIKI